MFDEPYLGEIRLFAGRLTPQGWHICDGSLLSVSQNQALFSLLGNRFGGNGRTTFALPNLYGRMVQGTDGDTPGRVGGEAQVSLQPEHLPPHTHHCACSGEPASSPTPSGHVLAQTNNSQPLYAKNNSGTLHASSITSSGLGHTHNNTQPSLVIYYIISLTGIYPEHK
ncbi:phage tail protein [Marinobacterium stanieri]|uniref:phage tail protein n=1 Tax=Marinobacterium stanieri TaxID=49186 RepID=UPI0002559E78|nr:tail fiber protein [Marinobacterium stanieri]